MPAADTVDVSTFVLGVDAYYYFTDVDTFIKIGATAGFRNFFGNNIKILEETFSTGDGKFLPLAAAVRVKIFVLFLGGLGVGSAVDINDGNDGGFYFRPVVGFDIADKIELNNSYESITTNGLTWGNITVGVLFES